MTNKEILQADMLDILFEHRNKTYGAYALRKEYNNRLGIALVIALSVALLSVLYSYLNNKNNTGISTSGLTDSIIVRTYNIPLEPKEPEKIIEKPKPKAAQVDYQNIIVVKDILANKPIVENADISNADIGNETIAGEVVTGFVQQPTESTGGNGLVKEKEPEDSFIPNEVAPSYPGGVQAWLSFLRRYLQTPEELEAGQRIEVRIKFWIDADGSVSRFEVVQSGGSSFDKEVLRVMKKMPKWEPAVQNRIKVAVAYTQPVIFVGVEE